MRVNLSHAHSSRKGPHQGDARRLGRFLIVADVAVVDHVHAPVVLGLPVDGPATLNGDVLEVLADQQPVRVKGRVLLGSEENGARGDIESDMAAKVEGSGGVVARRQIHRTAARFSAGVDGFLNGRPGIVGLLAGGSVSLHAEDRWADLGAQSGARKRSQDDKNRRGALPRELQQHFLPPMDRLDEA